MNSSEKHKPRLVVVLSRFPFPTEKGDKLRAFYQIRDLSKDWDIYAICLSEQMISEEHKAKVNAYCKELHIFQLDKWKKLFNTGLQFFTTKPFQVGYFYQHSIHHQIDILLKRIEPDHIFCQLIRAAEYVKNYHSCTKTIDYMDALSAGIKRRIPQSSLLSRWLFRSEWKRLTRYENILFDYFEYHTIISEQDRDLIAHPQRAKIDILPNGVGEHFFNYSKPVQKTHDLVFTGNLSYPPNINAVHYITHEICPVLKASGRNVSVLISGANPVSEIERLQGKIDLTGWVEDIRDSYAKGIVFVAPMFIGTGLQNKLLEAMAMGIPCITTPLANNALGADSSSILLAETPEGFADKIQMLLSDEELRERYATNGQNYVKANFNWNNLTQKLSDKMMAISR